MIERNIYKMSAGESVGRFIQALFDPNLTREQKDRLCELWNEDQRRIGKGKRRK